MLKSRTIHQSSEYIFDSSLIQYVIKSLRIKLQMEWVIAINQHYIKESLENEL